MKGFIRFRGFGFPKMCQASAGRLQCIPPRASAGHSVWNTCKFNLRDITEFNSCAWWDNFYIQYVRRELKRFVLIPRYKCKRFIRDISLRAPGRYLTDKSHVIFIGIALAISVSISNYFIHQVRLSPHKWTAPPPGLLLRGSVKKIIPSFEYTSETHSQALTKCSHFEGEVEPQKVPTRDIRTKE